MTPRDESTRARSTAPAGRAQIEVDPVSEAPKIPSPVPTSGDPRHERLREIFLEALEVDAAARPAWLGSRCGGDRELAADAAALLRLADSPPLPGDAPPEDAAAPGSRVGPFVVERPLGSGGMGSVHLAVQCEPVERRVALKILRSPTLDAQVRFRSEAQALAALAHPRICRYLDSGVATHGVAYLAMEWIEGDPLDQHLARTRPSVEEAVSLAIEVAEAVQHAHQRGIVHRDLKPANILLRRRGDGVEPVVIDFGVARAVEGSELAALLLTTRLAPIGTPAFMAPEQTRLDRVPDVRSDIYALGAVLFLLLAGRPPLELAPDDDLVATFLRIREQPAPRASDRVSAAIWPGEAGRQRGRRIRGDLDAIVAKALEKHPEDRYASAAQFAADLEAWRAGRPVDARPIGRVERFRRLLRRRPVESFLVGGAAAALVAGSGLALAGLAEAHAALREARVQTRIAEDAKAGEAAQRLVAETQRNKAVAQGRIATAVASFLADDLLARASPELDGPDTPVIEVVRAAVARTAPALDETPLVEMAVRSTIARVLGALGELDAAESQLALAAPAAAALPADDPSRIAFDATRGALLLRRQRLRDAEATLRDAWDRGVAALGAAHPTSLRAASDLASALESLGRPSEAVAILEPLEASLRDRPLAERVSARTTLASARRRLGEGRAAIVGLLPLLAEATRDLGPEHYFTMALHSDLAVGYLNLFEPAEALPHAERAVEIALASFGPEHPTTLIVRNNLASCLGHLGRVAEAARERESILAAYRAAGTPPSPMLATAINNLATALIRAERPDEATSFAEEGARMSTELLGEAHPTAGWAWGTFASALARTGRVEESRQAYERCLAIFGRAEGDHAASIERIERERERLLQAVAGERSAVP